MISSDESPLSTSAGTEGAASVHPAGKACEDLYSNMQTCEAGTENSGSVSTARLQVVKTRSACPNRNATVPSSPEQRRSFGHEIK